MRACAITLALAIVCAAPAAAQTVSERADATTLTIYATGGGPVTPLESESDLPWARQSGLAQITETRIVDLPAGPSELRFRNVVSTMVPETADIKGLPAGSLERNFDYNLLSPGSLLAKSVGATVHLIRTNPKTGRHTDETAIVRSGADGAMLEAGGKLEALHCSGLAEKLIFDKVPDGLTDVPTLSVRIDLPQAGRYTLTLSYLATALGWSSNYVAQIHPERNTLDLLGWITLGNFSDTNFEHVPVQFVAGAVNLSGEDEPVQPEGMKVAYHCWTAPKVVTAVAQQEVRYGDYTGGGEQVETVVVTGSRIPDPRVLSDYKLYTLPEPTSVAALQLKQIQFLDQREVPFERVYSYLAQDEYSHDPVISDTAQVSIRLQNRADQGLGKPLPAGQVVVNELTLDGDPILLGQGQMGNVAVGLPVEFGTGNAMGVYIEQRLMESHKLGDEKDNHAVNTFEVDIENQKSFPINFELDHGGNGAGFRILAEDRPHRTIPYGVTWDFHLNPGEKVRLHFTADEGHY